VWRKEDGNPQSSPENNPGSMNSTTPPRAGTSASAGATVSPNAAACVSQGIRIKGELSGSEDLFIDGFIDGKISLGNSVLTVGPNATVKAEITAREVVLRGRAEGKFTATERIQIWRTARVEAELKSDRISIEEGAELRGKVEAGRATNTAASGVIGQGKKTDASKAKGSGTADEKTASGAATAGAD
jgi:cytoskeletal protein CcmA (bactofilin family)